MMANRFKANHATFVALRSIGSQSDKCELLLSALTQGLAAIANIARHDRLGESRAFLSPCRQPDSLD
jgi:hypothetical protein